MAVGVSVAALGGLAVPSVTLLFERVREDGASFSNLMCEGAGEGTGDEAKELDFFFIWVCLASARAVIPVASSVDENPYPCSSVATDTVASTPHYWKLLSAFCPLPLGNVVVGSQHFH